MRVSPLRRVPFEVFTGIKTYPLFDVIIRRAESTLEVATLQLGHGDHMPSLNFIVVDDHGGLARCDSHIIKSLERKKNSMTTLFKRKKNVRDKNNLGDHKENWGRGVIAAPEDSNFSMATRSHQRRGELSNNPSG